MSDVAFIVGNGTTRKDYSLEKLKTLGEIYACNAFYRDYGPEYNLPDYLVAIDDGMIEEILASDFPQGRFIIPPLDERWEPAACNPVRPRSNAGINAMWEAIKRGKKTLIGLGFDFLLIDRDQSCSNLFDGTQNYGPQTRARWEDNLGRANYLNWLAVHNPTVDFIFAFPKIQPTIKFLTKNIYIMTYEQLDANISNNEEK